jgi:tetratricopeptide (TPR) repeat protein
MTEPERATAVTDSSLAAQVVAAYAQPLDFSAMPVLVRLTAHDKLEVRLAARKAVARFGRNAIWQLRTLYQEATSERADPSWDSERTARKLYTALDRSAIEQADRWIEQGNKRLEAGDVDGMQAAYDRVLAVFPWLERGAALAPGYAALGTARLEHDRLQDARQAYDRALRLDPHAPDHKRWRAQLAFIDAEISLSRGVIDLHGYERAIGSDPTHAAARDALDRLSGARAEREQMHKRAAAFGALGLLVPLAWMLLRGRGRGARASSQDAQRA